jgi:hypothetical protein
MATRGVREHVAIAVRYSDESLRLAFIVNARGYSAASLAQHMVSKFSDGDSAEGNRYRHVADELVGHGGFDGIPRAIEDVRTARLANPKGYRHHAAPLPEDTSHPHIDSLLAYLGMVRKLRGLRLLLVCNYDSRHGRGFVWERWELTLDKQWLHYENAVGSAAWAQSKAGQRMLGEVEI